MSDANSRARSIAFALLCLPAATALADHGPGGTGGGVTTLSAETLGRGALSIALGIDGTVFQSVDDPEGMEMAARSGHHHVDVLERSHLGSVRLGWGITDDLELALTAGYYWAENARIFDPPAGQHEEEGEDEEHAAHGSRAHHDDEDHGDDDGGRANPAAFDPDGPTDVWLHLKYRFHRQGRSSTAVVGGLKAPVGDDESRDAGGEEVEPASTAGSGAWDVMAGVAHSRKLSGRVDLDASLTCTIHQEHDDYRIGDRADGGVALSWRVSPRHTPVWRLVAEIDGRWRDRNEEGGRDVESSGGFAIFGAAGVSVVLTEHAGASLTGVAPLLEDPGGEQIETAFALQGRLSLTF